MNTTEIKPLHVGNLIKNYFDIKRIRKNALGRHMGKTGSSVLQATRRSAILTSTLLSFCHALKHNFFADIAATLPDYYSTDAPPDNTNANRIAALEKENELLQERVKVLMEMRK